ncbi:MAG TPA: hypothetical protein VF109_06745 [Mycobacteriales bacterium]
MSTPRKGSAKGSAASPSKPGSGPPGEPKSGPPVDPARPRSGRSSEPAGAGSAPAGGPGGPESGRPGEPAGAGSGPSGDPAGPASAGTKSRPAGRKPAKVPAKGAGKGGSKGTSTGKGSGKAPVKGSARKGGAGKGRPVPPPPGPGLVVGQVPLLARAAGGLGLAGAVLLLAAAFPPLAYAGGARLGGFRNVWDLVPALPVLLVVGAAGLLVARGRLPRLGMAVLLSGGTLAAGELLRALALLDTRGRSTVDLPLGIATSARYEAGAGLVLLVLAYGLLTVAAVAAGVAWSTTVMEDDGTCDRARPNVATWGLIVGCLGALAFGMAPYSSTIGLDPGTVPERTGLDLLGGLVLTLGTAVWAVVAATLRPRLAVAGAYAGLAAVLGSDVLATLLLVVRSPGLRVSAGTVGELLAVLAFTALALAVAPVRGTFRRAR